MLQQVNDHDPSTKALTLSFMETQVATVIEYYNRWMEAFPTIYDLAKADIEVSPLFKRQGPFLPPSLLYETSKSTPYGQA
jgi:A/G-specific adenine glycosylase